MFPAQEKLRERSNKWTNEEQPRTKHNALAEPLVRFISRDIITTYGGSVSALKPRCGSSKLLTPLKQEAYADRLIEPVIPSFCIKDRNNNERCSESTFQSG
jgi:hypothetical protein